MHIENNNLKIRNATAADAATLCKWWNDGAVMAHAGFPLGLNTTVERIAASLERDTDQNRRLMIEIDSVTVGEMSYRAVDEQTAEIGIKICEPIHRDKGAGTELLRMLIEYLFNEMGFEKIILDTNSNNLRAQHVYKKLGFRQTQIRVDGWKDQLGVPQTSIDYELTRQDYF